MDSTELPEWDARGRDIAEGNSAERGTAEQDLAERDSAEQDTAVQDSAVRDSGVQNGAMLDASGNAARLIPPGANVLIVTAVAAERDAVLRGLQGSRRFHVIAAGAGTAAAAAGTAAALAAGSYGCVISAGIGGGFPGRAPVGSLVVASEMLDAALGAETPEGFRSAAELGFGSVSVPAPGGTVQALAAALAAAGLAVSTGTVLTVSTATGTAGTAAELAARHPQAAAEAMEGHGVAVAARALGIAALELRAISNPVGPRDRAAWKIKEALDALTAAAAILLEVL